MMKRFPVIMALPAVAFSVADSEAQQSKRGSFSGIVGLNPLAPRYDETLGLRVYTTPQQLQMYLDRLTALG